MSLRHAWSRGLFAQFVALHDHHLATEVSKRPGSKQPCDAAAEHTTGVEKDSRVGGRIGVDEVVEHDTRGGRHQFSSAGWLGQIVDIRCVASILAPNVPWLVLPT